MRAFFINLILICLPLAGLVRVLLGPVQRLMAEGKGLPATGLMLGAVAIMAVLEALIFYKRILPALSHRVTERLYSGNYAAENDPLVALADRMREENDRSLLPQLEALVEQDPGRVRSWLELARLRQDVCGDLSGALNALVQGAGRVTRKEDRAMLLYRAAQFCENHLHTPSQAQEYLRESARKYPRTTYGKKAKQRLV